MKKNILLILALICSVAAVSAQNTLKTAYFMDRMTTRHEFNPALMTEYGYLAFPVVGDMNIGLNSKLSIDKFLFPIDNGQLGLFLHPQVDPAAFLKKLSNNNVTNQELNLSVFSFGFHGFGGFNTFDISVREEFGLNLKKSLFEFLVGNESGAHNMTGSSIDLNAWTEIGIGHSHKINDALTIGVKVKYLVGVANASLMLDRMVVNTTADEILVDLHAKGNAALVGTDLNGNLGDISFDNFDISNGLNTGFGVDLGATYELNKFTFSLAMTDLGAITWNKASLAEIGVKSRFTGFEDMDFNDFESSTEGALDNFTAPFEDIDNPKFTPTAAYRTTLNAKLNVGAEYKVLEKISLGALWTTKFGPATTTELIAIGTLSPASWFDFAVSGTVSSYGTYWGWAMNICPRWINFFIGMDSMISSKVTPQFIPYSSTNVNLKLGLSIPLGRVHKVN